MSITSTTELEQQPQQQQQQQQQLQLTEQEKKKAEEQTALLQRAYDKELAIQEERKRKERKMDESRIKVLLIGARHLASWIVYYMRNHATFIVIDRQDPESIFINPLVKQEVPRKIVEGYQISEMDIQSNLVKILERNRIDFVINTLSVHDAGFSSANPNYTYYVNNIYTQSIMNAIAEAKEYNDNMKFVHCSSDKVYGNTGCPAGLNTEHLWEEFIINEKEPCNPLGAKAISRYTQEIIVAQMCKTLGIDYVIFRLGNLWGRYTTQHNVINSMMIDALRTRIIHIYGDKWASRHLLNIEDFAEFLRDFLNKNYDRGNWNDIYNVGGHTPRRQYIYGIAMWTKTMLSGGIVNKNSEKSLDPKASYVLPWLSVKVQNDPQRFYEDSEEAGIRIWLDTGKESKLLKKLGYLGVRDIKFDEYYKELLAWNAHYHVSYSKDQIENLKEKITYKVPK